MFNFRKKKVITVDDVLKIFSTPKSTSLLDIPFRTSVSADVDNGKFNSGLFNLNITMMCNGFTTNAETTTRPGSAAVTYSAVNIHRMITKVVPMYNQEKMLNEFADVLPIIVQRFVMYIQTKHSAYKTLRKIIAGRETGEIKSSKTSRIEDRLIDELVEYLCDFDDVHASTPAFKHLVCNNILQELNYKPRINTKVLQLLL